MLNFNDNNKWIIGIVLSLLGLLVPVIGYMVTQEKKSLSYDIVAGSLAIYTNQAITEESLVSSNTLISESVEVVYNNEKLKNLHFHLIKIRNNGNIPIKRQDFDRAIKIIYPKESRLLSAKLLERHPKNLDFSMSLSGNSVAIQPLLLNENEYFIIQALTSGQQIDPNIDTRIVGINLVEKERKKAYERLFYYILFTIALTCAFLYGIFGSLFTRKKIVLSKFLHLLAIFSFGLSSAFLVVIFTDFKNLTLYSSWPVMLMCLTAVLIGYLYGFLVIRKNLEL